MSWLSADGGLSQDYINLKDTVKKPFGFIPFLLLTLLISLLAFGLIWGGSWLYNRLKTPSLPGASVNVDSEGREGQGIGSGSTDSNTNGAMGNEANNQGTATNNNNTTTPVTIPSNGATSENKPTTVPTTGPTLKEVYTIPSTGASSEY